MANFDQNVTINLSVDSQGVQSKLAAAAGEIQGLKQSLDGLDSDFDNATGSLQEFADAAGDPISPALDLDGIEDEMDEFSEFADSLETVAQLKDEVAESNKVLSDRNEDTTDSTQAEAQSFEDLMESASSLSDAKDAVTKANSVLDDQNEKTQRSILREQINMEAMEEAGLDVEQMLDSLVGKQDELKSQSDESGDAIDMETRSFEEMIDGASSLEEAKHAVANANQRIQNESGKSRDELIEEEVAMGDLNDEALRLRDNNDSISDTTRSVTRSIRRMRDATDDSSESMRAAAEVGDLFEDGLGSLSVNLGAFTIALRNFLTQVPLLLTALGALGAAALGAASAFVVLAGALGAVVAAGALAHAQELKQQYSEIEGLGQSLEVIMRNLFDVFLQAIQPLMQLEEVTKFFTVAVEGLATGVNMLSNAIAFLVSGNEDFVESASEAGEEMFTIQDAINSFDGRSWENVIVALMESWLLLGEEVTWALGAINNALADAISRSSQLLSEVENVSSAFGQFGDTISELAELGFTIGSGLLPVFTAFSSVVETVASALNDMDDAMLANAITFLAVFAATSRVAGTMASLIRVVPSVVTGFRSISAATKAANTSFGAMQIAMSGVLQQVGTFLTKIGAFGGLSELALAAGSTGEAFREIAFSSAEAQAHFQALALGSNVTAEDLQELAIQGRLTGEQIEALGEESAELNDELRKTQLQAVLTEEQLDELDGVDANLNVDGGVVDPGQFQETSSKVEKLDSDLLEMSQALNNTKMQSEKTVASQGLLAAVTETLALSTIKARIAQHGYIGALKMTIKSLAVAIVQKGLMIAANLGLISSEIAAAGATALLDAAITSLTGGLNKVIPAIIALIVIIGALAVGIIKNFDGIKSAFTDIFNVIAAVVGAIVDLLMTTFIATWEALRMTIEPLLRPFKTLAMAIGGTGDSAKEGAGAVGLLKSIFDALLSAISFIIRAIGVLGKIVMTFLIIPFELIAIAIGAVIDLFQWLSGVIANAITAWGPFRELFDDTADDANGLIGVIKAVFDATIGVMKDTAKLIEHFLNNTVIGGINAVISKLNNVPGVNISNVGEIDITRDEAGVGGEADVDPKKDNTIMYNEDNSTNIDQTVNADPEDQAQLSRVVTDAIAEANSFERRRQGGQ